MWILQFLPSKCNSASLWQPIKKKNPPTTSSAMREMCVIHFTTEKEKSAAVKQHDEFLD